MGEIDPLTWTIAYSAGQNSATVLNGYSAEYVVDEMRWMYNWCFENVRNRISLYCENPQEVWDTIFPDGLPEFNVRVTSENSFERYTSGAEFPLNVDAKGNPKLAQAINRIYELKSTEGERKKKYGIRRWLSWFF